MEIRILEEHPNPLLKRHEYRFEVAHPTAATPSRDAVRGELSKLFKAAKDRIIVERMAARFGTATTRGDAVVYETADAAKSIVREHILIRNGLKEKVVKGTTPAAETPAAATPTPPAATEAPKPEPAKAEPPKEATPKTEHKPEHKADHKSESKDEPTTEPHKGEHKAKGPKAAKEPAVPKAE